MRFVLSVLSVLSVLLMFWASTSSAQSVVQIGDSIGLANRNRLASSQWLTERGESAPDWIGRHGTPPTFAVGGFRYEQMLNGRNEGEIGLLDVFDSHAAPDALYILGGYNDAIRAADDSDMQAAIEVLRSMLDVAESEWPETRIYLSNVTLLSVAGIWNHKQSNVLTLNALISQEAASRESVTLVDNYSIIDAGDLNADGLHLNNGGQIKIGENFASVFSDTFSSTLLGDCNLDSDVDLFDIAPFIAILTSDTVLAQADCNQDGEVNLFDIAPFIAILTGR